MSFMGELIQAMWVTGMALAPSLFLGLLIAGLLHVFVKRERIFRHLGKPGFTSVMKASLLGVPLPLCSCGVLPAALSLRKDGASKGAAVSFLSSTPQTGVDSIVPTWAMLGWPVALAKVIAAFAAGLISGTVVDLIEKENGHRETPAGTSHEETGSIPRRIWNYAWGTLFGDIFVWLFIGIGVSALITVFIEPGQLSDYEVLKGPLGMAAALAVGIPLYVCSVSSIPIAAALVYAGFPVGSALVFLMAGPVTNAATMGAVRKKFGRTAFLSYIVTVIAVSILAGFLLNNISIAVNAPMHVHGESSILAVTAAGLMFLGIAWQSISRLMGSRGASLNSAGAGGLVYDISGMSCRNCVRTVTEAIEAQKGIRSVAVSLTEGNAVVHPGKAFSESAVLRALDKAGFPGTPAKQGSVCCNGTCERN